VGGGTSKGSWIAGVAVNAIAEDMTKEGIKIVSKMDPEAQKDLDSSASHFGIWESFADTIAWGRLYGGALGMIMIDGQDPRSELRIETVGKNQFKGIMVFDRWMVEPDLEKMVRSPHDNSLVPRSYWVVASGSGISFEGMRVHHSRVFRHEGVRLPYWQRVMENMWGISVLERLYDRLVAFDSATNGAAQLMYKSYLRTFAVENLRETIAAGGQSINNLMIYVEWMRRFQGIEGITLIDMKDKFEGQSGAAASFSGMAEGLVHFGQQISGGLEIPLVRLFGQAPAGLNATGESDWRNYDQGINKRQERELRIPIDKVYRIMARSEGIILPEDFSFTFVPLLQMTDEQKADTASKVTTTVQVAEESGLVSRKIALKELKTSSESTGIWGSITQEDIDAASDIALPPMEETEAGSAFPGMPAVGGENGAVGQRPGVSLSTGGRVSPPFGPAAHNTPSAGGGPGGLGSPSNTTVPPSERARGLRVYSKADGIHLFPKTKDSAGSLVEFRGLPIFIETKKGERRRPEWPPVAADYGFIRLTGSAEGPGEGLDCFIGPDSKSDNVWIVNQVDPDNGSFDEHKALCGFSSRQAAIKAYGDSYDNGGTHRIGSITAMTWPEFQQWLETGNVKQAA